MTITKPEKYFTNVVEHLVVLIVQLQEIKFVCKLNPCGICVFTNTENPS